MNGQPLVPDVAPAEAATIAINYKHPDDDGTYALPTKLAVWWKRYKMIIDCNDGSLELYDLAEDSLEPTNVVGREPRLCASSDSNLGERIVKQTGTTKLTYAKIG